MCIFLRAVFTLLCVHEMYTVSNKYLYLKKNAVKPNPSKEWNFHLLQQTAEWGLQYVWTFSKYFGGSFVVLL